MSSPLCNPRFLEHLKQSKAKTKDRMHLKVDRMIDRVYSEVLADLHKFFTFDDGLVRPRGVHFDGEPAVLSPCTIMQQHNQSSNITPTDVTTMPNVSQNRDYQFDAFQTLIPQSIISTIIKPPNIAEPINSEQPQQITQHANDMDYPTPLADFEEPEVKDEFDETIVELCNSKPNSHFSQSFALVCQANQNLVNYDDEDDEEECDCDDCVNGGLEGITWNEVDDGDSVDWFEDNIELEESHQPAKKARMGTIQPNNAQTEVIQQGSTQTAQPNQVINQEKHYITVHLQCTQLDCCDTFPEDQLNQHMLEKHHLGPSRCLVKDCKQSFDNKYILRDHIKQSHQHTTKWHCDKCHKHFNAYKHLYTHKTQFHHLGHFQCSYPSCTFTGKYKMKVYNHYTHQHKPTQNCQHFGCNFQTRHPHSLTTHQRIHTGVKPYRCKWPECNFSGSIKKRVIFHIRRHHLAPKPGSVPNRAQLDPKDYVEVVHDLL